MIAVETYRDRPVAVFGLGDSGIAAARSLIAGGALVSAWDDGEAARIRAAEQGVTLVDPDTLDWSRQAALVLAPGVPLTHPAPHRVAAMAMAVGIPIIGDIELFSAARASLPPHAVVAITGTNGKSTTTALTAHLIEALGGDAVACGNIGAAILDLDPLPHDGVYVIEMSSYQIDLTPTLKPEVAMLLNISEDHIDRHGTLENYVNVKRRIFARQGPTDVAIVGIDDPFGPQTLDMVRADGIDALPVSVGSRRPEGVSVENGLLWDADLAVGNPVCDLSPIPTLRGRHNWQNAACAYAALRALGQPADAIAEAFKTFPGLPHRMETVAELGGVLYVNDSKATNADAAARALDSFTNIHWIAGGRAKEGGIASLGPFMDRVTRAYLIGEAEDEFARTLGGMNVAVDRCGTMENALHAAARNARAGDVVLLSPACASFDRYRNFGARGDHFRSLVADLKTDLRTSRCA